MTMTLPRWRSAFLAAATVIAGLILTACSPATTPAPSSDATSATASSDPTAAPSSDGATRVVSTAQGDVTIPTNPEKIVVVNADLTGYLYALDIPVYASYGQANISDSGYPSWAEHAERDATQVIEGFSEDGMNVEEILALDPDLIVGGGQGLIGSNARDAYDELSKVAPTVLVGTDALTWQDHLSFFADVFDVADREAELVNTFNARVTEVSAAITLPENPVAYLMLLENGDPFLLPEDSDLPQLLAQLGFEPDTVVADHPEYADAAFGSGDTIELSREQVIEAFTAPTLIYLGWQGGDIVKPAPDALTGDPIYSTLPAVKSGNAFELPYWAFRTDYLRSLALLDLIEEQFS
ncbi:ABC transporter substrate-binding protein [Tessaracoccus caeni]|uniref:ABC transporter substrate-binding protein n=1 Tax=Tessaracoccus caeni TaxID=3031239 RepID=UPI0023DBA6AB|nr:ABC transporter substrate-binding protein [Tessaracoccus caeni]MDF1487103.1 ABC transporter substrate-binding protein [Tessaracoccus caeni]